MPEWSKIMFRLGASKHLPNQQQYQHAARVVCGTIVPLRLMTSCLFSGSEKHSRWNCLQECFQLFLRWCGAYIRSSTYTLLCFTNSRPIYNSRGNASQLHTPLLASAGCIQPLFAVIQYKPETIFQIMLFSATRHHRIENHLLFPVPCSLSLSLHQRSSVVLERP